MAPRSRVQYQVQTFVAVVAAAVTISTDFIYPWSEPVRTKPPLSAHLQQAAIGPVLNPETQITQNFESRWHQPWSEPRRTKAALPAAEQQFIAFVPPVAENITADKWNYAWSEPVRIRRLPAAAQPFIALAPFVVETITPDKWLYPWSEPVRQKAGLAAQLQQSAAATTLDPDTQIIQTYESRWHYSWSEPVRLRQFPASEQQSFAFQPPSFEIVTVDKWVYPWSEPVRQKSGLWAHLQQSFIATTLEPNTQITQTFESRWHYPWSEPVRQRAGLGAYLQQALAAPATTPAAEVITADKWLYPWPEPVRQKSGLGASLQQALVYTTFQPAAPTPGTGLVVPVMDSAGVVYPVRYQYQARAAPIFFVAETITADKWLYAWSEPVRQRQGLGAHLQQALIATTLNPETQIIQGFESRWHQGWSEPVRLRQFPAAEQQAFAFQPPSFEIITVDKWVYPWTEPVRQKAGLRTHLQQALIATTLDDETQIIQGYESRWHYAWSEPVRVKQGLLAASQQFSTGVLFVSEVITTDKWFSPWQNPVRQRPGLSTGLQQFLALDTAAIPVSRLEPWFQPFSEPVRTKPHLRTGTQQFLALDTATIPVSTLEPWFAPWSEPVRIRAQVPAGQQQFTQQAIGPPLVSFAYYNWLTEPVRHKPGLRASLQQALIAPVLNPETQIIQGFESRWHYPWSEPVRFRRLAVAQYPAITQPPTSVFELVTMDKWAYPLSEPVRHKLGLRPSLQQAFIGTVLDPNTQITQFYESRWHYPWSEPVRVRIDRRLAIALASSGLFATILDPETQITGRLESRWHYSWSEPVRQKPGLSPVYQQFLAAEPFLVPPHAITGTLFATEQGDLFLAGGTAFNQVNSALVGFIELVPRSALVGIQVDIPSISANVGALARNPSAQSGTATALVYSANVSIRKV